MVRDLLLRRRTLELGQARLDALAQLQVSGHTFLEVLNNEGIGIYRWMSDLRAKSACNKNGGRRDFHTFGSAPCVSAASSTKSRTTCLTASLTACFTVASISA